MPSRVLYPPLSYRIYRGVIVAAFVLALLLVGLGAAGHGPAHALAGPTDAATFWIRKQMGYTGTP